MLVPAIKLEDAQINVAGALWEEHVSPAYAAAEIWKSDFYPDFLRRLESFSRLYDAQGYEYRDFRPEADSLRASLGS